MPPQQLRLYNAATRQAAVVSLEPASQPGTFFVRVARGGGGQTYGPYPEAELAAAFAQAAASLRAEGFTEPDGLGELLAMLSHKDPKRRAQAARRMARAGRGEGVQPLLEALGKAVDDRCAVIDALGALGERHRDDLEQPWWPALREALRAEAQRKLLSRRRSAVEALRRIGDAEGVQAALGRTRQRLAQLGLLAAVEAGDLEALHVAIAEVVGKKRGLALDTLYELDDPVGNQAVRRLVGQWELDRAFVWRYVKSVLKRAMLRGDHATFGLLAHTIEALGRDSVGKRATVKSGYDGVKRETPIFSRKTQKYLRRAAWRYLRQLARDQPERYPMAAAEALIHYGPEDRQLPKGRYGQLAACYVLHRVLFGDSDRFDFDARTMKFAFRSHAVTKPAPGAREESFAELWQAQPRAYLRLLTAARLPEAHAFALGPIKVAHRAVLEAASDEGVLALLDAPYEPTVALGLEELARRFDRDFNLGQLDWQLLHRLLAADRADARALAHGWLELSRSVWTAELEQLLALLESPHGETRALVVELTIAAAPSLAPTLRHELAARLLARLGEPEPEPGALAHLARLGERALGAELASLCDLDRLMALIEDGSSSAKSLAGHLLGMRPQQALEQLGLPRVVALASDELVAVRRAAHALLRAGLARLREDPGLLLVLVESHWEDTRALAFALLREEVDFARVGLDGLVGLCDSTRADVQAFGERLVGEHFEAIDVRELIYRLAEHPAPAMRRFALDLATVHLPEGFIPLAKVEPLLRAVLFDPWPSRRDKDRVIGLLCQRGLRDEQQAQVAAGILDEAAGSATLRDFEGALCALAEIRLAFPDVDSALALCGPTVDTAEGGAG